MKKLLILGSLTVLFSLAVGIPTAQAGVCDDVNDWFEGNGVDLDLLDCGEEGDITSFVDFRGGLTAPTGEGLDTTLTRAGTARDFIRNTLNFVLSFLGIVALAVVIYGGFLYITAAGNEEQSGKGKKALTYAAIGIVIIIASFGLVNTLITSVGGGGEGGRGGGSGETARGVGEEGSNIAQTGIYNLGAAEVNASLNDFLGAYKNLAAMDSLISKMKNLPKPSDSVGSNRAANNRQYLTEIASALTEIKNSANSLSQTHIAAKRLLDGWAARHQGADLADEAYENGRLKTSSDPAFGFDAALAQSGLEQMSKDDFQSAINQLIGEDTKTRVDNLQQWVSSERGGAGKLFILAKILGDTALIPARDRVNSAVQRGLLSEKDISRAFAGIDPNTNVGDVLLAAVNNLVDARSLSEDSLQPEKVLKVAKSLNLLYIVVKNVEFVYVKIKASGREGSAPLIVELNGLESRDPTGQTIPPENYMWDPDGDGQDGVSAGGAAECNPPEAKAPTIVCTYNKTGTYLVRLSIASKDPLRTATGQAFLSVTVLPPVARISLKASVGNAVSEVLRAYEQGENGQFQLSVDKGEFQVTTEEAKEPGVIFDASESVGGGGEGLKSYEWSFGDGSEPVKDKSKIDPPHKYSREGKFPLRLEVTDRGNRKDRTVVNITVASIAARIGTDKTIGEPDELFEFDGSFSRSDAGSIRSYKWSVVNNQNSAEIIDAPEKFQVVGSRDGAVLRGKFKNPGAYTVELTVSDGSKTAVAKIENIGIKSRKPRANFVIRACPESCPDPSQPSLVEFDGSMSFDPDRNDVLTYDWSFFNENGDKLQPGTALAVVDNSPVSGQNAKKLRVKFGTVGKFKAALKVNDSHEDVNILQEDTKEKEFEILSTVEARWDPQIATVQKLEQGAAAFTFRGSARNAARASIEFGDGESGEQEIALTNNAGSFEFEHEYTRAGSFLATLKASSEEGSGENTISKRVYVSGGDAPLAVMTAMVDNIEVVLPDASPDASPDDPQPALEVIRNKVIKFNGAHSINSAGAESGLRYSWNFGDQKQSSGANVEHSYEDISPEGEAFNVTLTVSEIADPAKTNSAVFPVRVISKKPQVNTLSLEKKTAGEATPVDVELTAEGATDPDGRITNYQFWYFSPADRERKLSVIDTQSDHAALTVETAGAEGEEHEYLFCVSVTDNENTSSECSEMFGDEELPKLTVKNGPNKAPSAAFTADKTSVRVNEEVMFTSSSTDEDGTIKEYIWDLEGDGFQNDNPTELSTITHTYTRKSPASGYRMKLKVIDDKGAAGFSREIPIHVTPKSNPPTANFTFQVQNAPPRRVKFFDASTSDAVNGARITKWTWDFDTSAEYGCDTEPKPEYCNGNKADDADSTDQNPVFDYSASGTFQAKLIVEDSDGNVSEPKTAFVTLIAGAAGGTGGATPVSNILNSELKTDPAFRFETLGGTQKKVLRLPANSNGQPVTLFWGDSSGDIVTYKLDKNIWCDRDGNGNRSDDVDNPDTSGGSCTGVSTGVPADNCWTTNYQRYAKTASPRGPGNFTALLTVVDRNGATDTDNLEVIFEGTTDPARVIQTGCDGSSNLFGASLFQRLGARNTILLGLLGGVIVVLTVFGMASFVRQGKKRV